MVTIHGLLFQSLDLYWKNLERFFYEHKTLFDIFFLMAYFLQQLFLFILILLKPAQSALYVGVFALVILTTFSLEKTCMESRYRRLNEFIMIKEVEGSELLHEYLHLQKDYNELKTSTASQKSLYNHEREKKER